MMASSINKYIRLKLNKKSFCKIMKKEQQEIYTASVNIEQNTSKHMSSRKKKHAHSTNQS